MKNEKSRQINYNITINIFLQIPVLINLLPNTVPWRRKWQHTPVLLPRKFHGWRSQAWWATESWTQLSNFTTSRILFHDVGMLLLVSQLCPTLCDPVYCSPPRFSVNGVLQARILDWFAFPTPGALPDTGIEPPSPAWAGRFFTV